MSPLVAAGLVVVAAASCAPSCGAPGSASPPLLVDRARFAEARTFLSPGPQMTMSPSWRLPRELQGARPDRAGVERVLAYVAALRFDDADKDALFRKRTAEQILRDGFATGCTDYALAALPLLRALGIPAVYVEAIDQGWLDAPDMERLHGHVFVEALVDGAWTITNPQRGAVERTYRGWHVVARGADAWDVGIADLATSRAVFALALQRRAISDGAARR